MRHLVRAGLATALLAAPSPRLGGAVRLLVDDPAGLVEPWPMVCGVPFAKGVLQNPGQVRLLANDQSIPCQVETAATWPDGSIKWVRLSFRGRPDAEYAVQWDAGLAPAPSGRQIRIEADESGTTIHTGQASFRIPPDSALVDRATIDGKTVLSDAGRGAYVLDNQGRRARLGGPSADIQQRLLQNGPLHACMRSEGWYVTTDGEQLARGIVWLHFFADSPSVRLVHRLVLTEDTNQAWFRDIGIEFPTALTGVRTATFDTAKAFDDLHTSVPLPDGSETWMIQDDFPHFMSKTSHFALGMTAGGQERELASGDACGEWCDLSNDDAGLTVVLRDLAEQFPKELTVGPDGVTLHLWAGRCGRELDFRAATLVEEYWGDWCKHAPGGPEAVAKLASNAQSSAKTHEIWLMPHLGPADPTVTARRAHAATTRILAVPDPAYTCSTGALGLPISHRDPERFPEQEALISDFFDRVMLPFDVFPMTGYIAWGCNPYLEYLKDKDSGGWYARWYRLRYLVDYNLRRNVWTLYGRSGDRKYFDYGERFNRFAGDMEMHHWDCGSDEARNRKVKGGWAGEGDIHKPFYWAVRSEVLTQNSSGTDLVNCLYQYYLTGDWHVRESVSNYAEAMKRLYDRDAVAAGPSPFLVFRCLCTAYAMDWDPEIGRMMHDVGRLIIDLESPNGLTQKMAYGCLYKVTRNVSAALDYWLMTGDERTKQGFLKAVDYQYRFQRDGPPITYQNGSAMYYAMAHRFTKRPVYLEMVQAALRTARQTEMTTLAQDLAPGIEAMPRLPYRPCHVIMHPLFSTPVALKMLAEAEAPVAPWPVAQQAFDAGRAWAVFEKTAGREIALRMYIMALHPDPVRAVVLGPDQQPAADARVETEQRIPYYGDPGAAHFHAEITLPGDLPAGTYRVGLDRGDAAFRVTEATVGRVVLECPEGVWLGGGGLAAGQPVYFRVPEGQDTVKLFLGREAGVFRSDGSRAQDVNGEQIGEVTLPVEGNHGFWRAEWHEPALIKFRNLDPVVCFGTTERWFRPEKLLDVSDDAPELPPADATFIPGVIGQALQINGKDVFQFARGKALGQGKVGEVTGFQHFPGPTGTIECYFRPNWNTTDYPVLNRQLRHRHLVHAGELQLYHRFGQGPVASRPYAYVDILCRGPWGRPGQEQVKPCGNMARAYLRAGEWIHVAATWAIDITQKERDDKAKFHVFINGRRRLRVWDYPRKLGSWYPFRIGDIPEWIRIGVNADGSFDELRVSDVVRYEADFTPPTAPFQPDPHTKALFHFDGTADGAGADGTPLTVEYTDR